MIEEERIYEELYKKMKKKAFEPGDFITQSEESVVFFKQKRLGRILSLEEDKGVIDYLRSKNVYRVERVEPTKNLDTFYFDEDGDLLAFESKFMRLATEEEIRFHKLKTMF